MRRTASTCGMPLPALLGANRWGSHAASSSGRRAAHDGQQPSPHPMGTRCHGAVPKSYRPAKRHPKGSSQQPGEDANQRGRDHQRQPAARISASRDRRHRHSAQEGSARRPLGDVVSSPGRPLEALPQHRRPESFEHLSDRRQVTWRQITQRARDGRLHRSPAPGVDPCSLLRQHQQHAAPVFGITPAPDEALPGKPEDESGHRARMKMQFRGQCTCRQPRRKTDDAQGEPLGAGHAQLPLHALGESAELLIERPESPQELERRLRAGAWPAIRHPVCGEVRALASISPF